MKKGREKGYNKSEFHSAILRVAIFIPSCSCIWRCTELPPGRGNACMRLGTDTCIYRSLRGDVRLTPFCAFLFLFNLSLVLLFLVSSSSSPSSLQDTRYHSQNSKLHPIRNATTSASSCPMNFSHFSHTFFNIFPAFFRRLWFYVGRRAAEPTRAHSSLPLRVCSSALYF